MCQRKDLGQPHKEALIFLQICIRSLAEKSEFSKAATFFPVRFLSFFLSILSLPGSHYLE